MSDYEATAYLSLEKLKEKHMHEFQVFQDKIRKELSQKMKFSKDLLDLRDREAKLVRMKRYDDAVTSFCCILLTFSDILGQVDCPACDVKG